MAGDPYKELGVSRTASADEIKKAFRKLAKELHPDTHPDEPETLERFKRVTAAFDVLGDTDKRAKYDAGAIDADGREAYRGGGSDWPGGRGGAGTGGFSYGHEGGPGGRASFDNIDLDELFGRFTGGNRGGSRAGVASRGQDVRATLDISLEDAVTGATRRIQFTDGRTLDVGIPKGAGDGQTIRLKGQGSPGRGGSGDALIELRIEPHPIFRLDGADLIMDLPVSVPDAVLGAKVPVRTPDGTVSMTIPKGANSGQVLRLKGRGGYAGGRRGDLMARIMVKLPDTTDEPLRKFAEEWRAKRPYRPER